MSVVSLSAGGLVVTIEEVPEERPVTPIGLNPLPDINGNIVVYERTDSLREVPVSGRVKTLIEIERLELWLEDNVGLKLTDRDSTETTGWMMKTGDPTPRLRRKDGDSADYLVDFRLWRLP